MGDLFISHASEDFKSCKLLARALEKAGWSVWCDKEPRDIAENALQSAKAVIVLWSPFSATDRYVIGEAQHAFSNNILFQTIFEDVFLSSPFNTLAAANLISWNGDINHPEFQGLVKEITKVVEPKSRGSKKVRNQLKSLDSANLPQTDNPSQSLVGQEPVITDGSIIGQTPFPPPNYDTEESPVNRSSSSKKSISKEGLFKLKYFVYASLAILVLILGWNMISKPSNTINPSTSESTASANSHELEENDEPKKFGMASKTVKPEIASTSTNDKDTQSKTDLASGQIAPSIETIDEDTPTAAQPTIYYPPVQKEEQEPSLNDEIASEDKDTALLSSEPDSDSLASGTSKKPLLIEPGSFFTSSEAGGQPMSIFSPGESVFIGATVYSTGNETFRMEWLTSEDQVLAEKRISTGKNTDGLKIYDSKKQFPGSRGQFKVRLYNSENTMLAEAVFVVN